MGAGRNNQQQQQQYGIQAAQLAAAQQNQQYQQMVQAMVNQRAVAGTQDSFGTTVQYDPTTNSWVQTLGGLPRAADTAAMQGNIIRNTTDLQQQELANRDAMLRAARAGPMANAAQLQLENYRPMGADQLTGLLTQQGIEAARQAYDPLRADTLRAVARTGTAAGPVLRQLGLGEAQNLRNTLIDAQIQGLQNVAGINTANQQRLASNAATTAAMATPQLGQQNLGTSAADQLVQQLTANRAQWAPSSTAQGSYGTNTATGIMGQAAGAAAGAVPNTNFGLDQTIGGLKSLSSDLNNPQMQTSLKGLGGLISSIFGGGGPNMSGLDPSTQGQVLSGLGAGGVGQYSNYSPTYDPSSWTPQSSSDYNF
jgi:hypothetical protein